MLKEKGGREGIGKGWERSRKMEGGRKRVGGEQVQSPTEGRWGGKLRTLVVSSLN